MGNPGSICPSVGLPGSSVSCALGATGIMASDRAPLSACGFLAFAVSASSLLCTISLHALSLPLLTVLLRFEAVLLILARVGFSRACVGTLGTSSLVSSTDVQHCIKGSEFSRFYTKECGTSLLLHDFAVGSRGVSETIVAARCIK